MSTEQFGERSSPGGVTREQRRVIGSVAHTVGMIESAQNRLDAFVRSGTHTGPEIENLLTMLSRVLGRAQFMGAACAGALRDEANERRRLRESLRKTLRARSVMAECNHILVHESDENVLVEKMCRIIVGKGGYPVAWIGVVRQEGRPTLVPVAHAGHEEGFLREWRLNREDATCAATPAGQVIRTGQAVLVNDLTQEIRWNEWRKNVLGRGYRSVLVLPLSERGRVFGILGIYDRIPLSFSLDEAGLLGELSDDIAYGIAALRTQAARERAERRLATQYEIARLLAESASLAAAAPGILQVLSETPNCEAGFAEFWTVDETGLLEWLQSWQVNDDVPAGHATIVCELGQRVAQSGMPVWLPAGSSLALGNILPGHSGYGFPVRFEGRVLGVVTLFGRELRKPREELVHLFTAIGSQIALFMVRKQAEKNLHRSQEQLGSILDSIDNIVWSVSPETGEIYYLNRAAETVWGKPLEQLTANPELLLDSLHPEDRSRLPGVLDEILHSGSLSIQYRVSRSDGEIRWLENRVKLVLDSVGKPVRLDGVATDITERKQYEASIEFLATHDALTRLPNRTLLADRLHQALAHARRSDRLLALIFLDLDRFKDVNDSYGHASGDALLQAVSSRLVASVRDGDTVARQGGDEFLVLLSDLEKMEDVEQVAFKIQHAFSRPFNMEGHEIFMSGSMGVSIFPGDGQDMNTLLKHADTAMYRAKEGGGDGFRFYSREMSYRSMERVGLENALRRALEQRQFEVFYQPKIDLESGRLEGAEALLRWRHPEHGLIMPARFIPLAEETGLIHGIGDWVLQAACGQLSTWRREGLDIAGVAVNLSARQLAAADLLDGVSKALRLAGLQGGLELEVTETMVMQEPERMLQVLMDLKALGVTLAIDDFGAGYSSLSYLKRFPFDHLKIDQSFVRDISTDRSAGVIVQSIISLGRSLGLKVIAEGVETQEQVLFLRKHRCNAMQGFHAGLPMPAEVFGKWLRNDNKIIIGCGT